MDEAERDVEAARDAELERSEQDWRAAREHSEHLQRRISELAEEVATTEDGVAKAYEASARLRPHAAERLRARAREARDYAAKERRASTEREPSGDAGPDAIDDTSPHGGVGPDASAD